MRKKIILIGLLLLFVSIFFSGCFFQENSILVRKTNAIPDRYVNISEQQIEQLPHLKEAILANNSIIKTPGDEFNKIYDLLMGDDNILAEYIKYHDEYYSIILGWGD